MSGEEYIHSATKKDINKMRLAGQHESMYPNQKLKIGLCLVVSNNKSLFTPNLVRDAKRVNKEVKEQLKNMRPTAISITQEVGRSLRMAKERGHLWEGELERTLESFERDDKVDDELVTSLMHGFEGGENSLDIDPE